MSKKPSKLSKNSQKYFKPEKEREKCGKKSQKFAKTRENTFKNN